MKSRRNSFNAIQGLWIPEHVRIAILENLRAEHGSDRKQKTMLYVRRRFQSLPMSEAELLAAIERLSSNDQN